jgi:hypothetical protein
MLSRSHNRAYQDFLTLLTELNNLAIDSKNLACQLTITQEFDHLKQWFEQNIDHLDAEGITPVYTPRWESIQREIKREFKLLTTDVLFLNSARQELTKTKRLKSISDRLTKLSGYSQGIIAENKHQELQ